MSGRKGGREGPSAEEIHLRAELDRTRRELSKLKKQVGTPAAEPPPAAAAAKAAPAPPPAPPPPAPPSPAPPPPAADSAEARADATVSAAAQLAEALANAEAADPGGDVEALRRQVRDLNETRQRLSRLYFSQVEENRKRALRLHQVLQQICEINAELDLERLLERIVGIIRDTIGYRIVLLRLREPGSDRLKARAFAGLDEAARAALASQDVRVEDFRGWLKDEFKVGRSYFISHKSPFSRTLPPGHVPDLGPREDWEWHPEDVLFVPLSDHRGELFAYFSVDDPVDRLVPSSETIELIEVFGHHAAVAIENARLYQEREAHTRELEENGRRMQELHALRSTFVSTVSHELRTPLTAIRAYVETLLSAGENELPAPQVRHFLEIVQQESQRLARLVESVLDLNRFDSGTLRMCRERIDLRELLEDSRGLLEPLAQGGQVALKSEILAADTGVDADRDQLRQLVLHLVSNAIKFTPEGGQVTIRLTGDDRDVTLQVEDTGIGIPPEALERIFERSHQVDSGLVRRLGGAGLGLAICRSIVEWHGGRVFAESAPGNGARFTVVLPRRSGPRVSVRAGSRMQAASAEVVRLAIEMVADVMNARVVSLLAPEADGELVIQAALGLDDAVVRGARIRPGQGVAGWVMEHRRPLCVSGDEAQAPVQPSGRAGYATGTFLSVPLEGEEGLLGVLSVTDPVAQKPFDAEDCHLLLHLAERVAVAWEQARAMERSEAGVADTARAMRDVLQRAGRARPQPPGRVRLARALARAMKLDESEVAVISFAANVPDVGPEPLSGGTSDSGAPAGEDAAHPPGGLGVARDVVLSHHEWWDGTGFPRGLAGEDIPIGGRILAVVDGWEGLTAGRGHRPALPREEALRELRGLAGRQFDPSIVEAIGTALEEVDRETGTASAQGEAVTPHAGR